MPLTKKGNKIMAEMAETYKDEDKAKQVFYASENAGTISGVHAKRKKVLRKGTHRMPGGQMMKDSEMKH